LFAKQWVSLSVGGELKIPWDALKNRGRKRTWKEKAESKYPTVKARRSADGQKSHATEGIDQKMRSMNLL